MVYLKYNTAEEIKKIKEIKRLKNEIEERGGSVTLYYDTEIILDIIQIEVDLKRCHRTLKLLNELESELSTIRRVLINE